MNHSWLVKYRGGDVTPARSGPLDGHTARFALAALDNRSDRGQIGHSASKANEKKSLTMKKALAAAGLGAAVALGSLVGAGTASAEKFNVCPSGHEWSFHRRYELRFSRQRPPGLV